MARELISSGERDNEAVEQPMNLAADGFWGAKATLMLPLTPHSPTPGPRGPGGTHDVVPSPPTQLQPGSGVSPTAMPVPCSTTLSEMSSWCLSLTQKSTTAAPQVSGYPHYPSHRHKPGGQMPLSAHPRPTHSQPHCSCTPLSLSVLISSALTSAWGLLAIERHVH